MNNTMRTRKPSRCESLARASFCASRHHLACLDVGGLFFTSQILVSYSYMEQSIPFDKALCGRRPICYRLGSGHAAVFWLARRFRIDGTIVASSHTPWLVGCCWWNDVCLHYRSSCPTGRTPT